MVLDQTQMDDPHLTCAVTYVIAIRGVMSRRALSKIAPENEPP